jgi:hypothetical protein
MPFPYTNRNENTQGGEDMECAAAGPRRQFAASFAPSLNYQVPPMHQNTAASTSNPTPMNTIYSQHYNLNFSGGDGGTNYYNNNNTDANVFYSTSDSEQSIDTHSNSVSTSLLVGTFYNPSETDSFSMEENNQSHSHSLSHSQSQNTQQSNAIVTSGHSWKDMFDNHDAFESNVQVIENPEILTKPMGSTADEHQMRRRRLLWGFTFLLVCILLVVAVSMGVVIGVRHTEKQQTDRSGADAFVFEPEQQGTVSPSGTSNTFSDAVQAEEQSEEDILPPASSLSSHSASESPSRSPSASPAPDAQAIASDSAAPSASPGPPSTTQSINTFVSQLPSFTRNALELPTSPQSRALHWLTADPSLASYSDARILQRYALATLYFATNGGNDELISAQWLAAGGWLSYDLHECSWFSTVENSSGNPCRQGVYTHLSLQRNNLQGTLPAEIALLAPQLEVLDFELNNIRGVLPSVVGLLTSLQLCLPAAWFCYFYIFVFVYVWCVCRCVCV